MEEEFEIDYKSVNKGRKQLERLTSDRYWNEYKGDWKRYLSDALGYDDIPQTYKKPEKVEKKEIHPFDEWI
jgi:hypothetical protein